MLYPEFFNQFDCDGEFKKITCRSAEGLAGELCDKLRTLQEQSVNEPSDTIPKAVEGSRQAAHVVGKRQTPPLFAQNEAKKTKKDSCSVSDLRKRCDGHLIDSKLEAHSATKSLKLNLLKTTLNFAQI